MKRTLRAGFSMVLLLSVTGCGQTTGGTDGGTTAVSNKVISNAEDPHLWVESFGVNEPNKYYILTDIKVKNVGKLISGTNLTTNGPGGWSSWDGVVAVYAIIGKDTNKAVAAKLKDGSYVEADFVGNKQP